MIIAKVRLIIVSGPNTSIKKVLVQSIWGAFMSTGMSILYFFMLGNAISSSI